MKRAALTIFLLSAFAVGACAQEDVGDDVKRFRETREKSFRSASETPLKAEDFARFKGLEYFGWDAGFAVKARLEKTSDEQIFMMPTSIGTTRKYFKYGVLSFELGGQKHSLTVFRSESSAKKNGLLFVPFRDRTNGTQTYGAGRYLDIKAPVGDEAVELDFNFAYNPACAYGRDDFSCAIPPKENFLQIEIKAGEKIFPYTAKKQ
ncbi:MAG TPA: DUF1684 domain-containing protein [Pyrinomonadaceae bacterium]